MRVVHEAHKGAKTKSIQEKNSEPPPGRRDQLGGYVSPRNAATVGSRAQGS